MDGHKDNLSLPFACTQNAIQDWKELTVIHDPMWREKHNTTTETVMVWKSQFLQQWYAHYTFEKVGRITAITQNKKYPLGEVWLGPGGRGGGGGGGGGRGRWQSQEMIRILRRKSIAFSEFSGKNHVQMDNIFV